MLDKSLMKWSAVMISLFLLLGTAAPGLQGNKTALAKESDIVPRYLPIVWRTNPSHNLFGVEIGAQITSDAPYFEQALLLPTKWIRLNLRISWRQLQPNEGDPIQWDLLADFENELRILRGANITPIVIVNDYPAWATTERAPGTPSYCGPLREDMYAAFADFTRQVVERYKTPEFNAQIWELGNEPDIDGAYYELPFDSQYGCWGDAADLEYYGGQRYGEMLQVVTPLIKVADPLAQVWVGGLLLNSPMTVAPGEGRPELFLQGILQAGVGTDYSYFDVVPYHAYSIYRGKNLEGKFFDYDDGDVNSPWFGDTWGGAVLGKARFLREIMGAYGVQKPLFVDEVSLTCPQEFFPVLCDSDLPLFDDFLQIQASHLVRVLTRGLSEDIQGFTWYTLDGPGWRNGGLLDISNSPRPSYVAYQVLTQQLINADYLSPVDYGTGIEGYAFRRDTQDIQVLWSELDVPDLSILVPASDFVEARARDGTLIAPALVDGNYQIPVGFSPIYIVRRP